VYLVNSPHRSTIYELKLQPEDPVVISDGWILTLATHFSALRVLQLTNTGVVTKAGAGALGRMPLTSLHMPDSKLMEPGALKAMLFADDAAEQPSKLAQHITDLDLSSLAPPSSAYDAATSMFLLASADMRKLACLKLSLPPRSLGEELHGGLTTGTALPQFLAELLTTLHTSLSDLTLVGSPGEWAPSVASADGVLDPYVA
jgi:hypothetical protein